MLAKLNTAILLLFCISLNAQDTSSDLSQNPTESFKKLSYKLPHDQHFSVQFMGLTYHPGGGAKKMIQHYPLKFDKKATFVLNMGAVINYDYDFNKRFFARAEGGFYMDCAYKKAAFVHLAVHMKTFTFGKHSFNFGLGPVLSIREDWHQFEDYTDTDFYGKRVYNGWQYRFFPLGGEVEYIYKINDDLDFQYSVIPGYPAVITSKFGLRWKL